MRWIAALLLIVVASPLGCGAGTRVAGSVTDGAGDPLTPDRIVTLASRGGDGRDGLDREEFIIRPTGPQFELEYPQRYAGVMLTVEKTGFYPARLILRRRDGGFERGELAVTMRPRRIAARPLRMYAGSLRVRRDGRAWVLDFDALDAAEPGPQWVQGASPSDDRPGTVADVTDPAQRPANGVVLLADVEPSGATLRNARLLVSGGGPAADIGFRRFEPPTGSDPFLWRRSYLDMTEAPRGGYERALTLVPKGRPTSVDETIRPDTFFWIRTTDGRYGKGYASRVSVSRGQASVTISVYLNPEPGDRRLEDGREGWGMPPGG